jgi:phosphoribosyl 1,2-cyclic phosphodiesterase
MESTLTFLGTAGTRYVVIRQERASGGIWLESDGTRILIDPGPGSLIRCLNNDPPLDPESLDAVILTHKHIDHANDVNIMVEAMTVGGTRRSGVLLAPGDALGADAPSVLPYVRDYLTAVTALQPHSTYSINGIEVETGPRHLHQVETYGLKFRLPDATLGIVADTRWFDDLPVAFQECDVLVINTVLLEPIDRPSILHLSVPEAEALIAAVRPRIALLTHFGRSILNAGPEEIATGIGGRTGIPVHAAQDGACFPLSE